MKYVNSFLEEFNLSDVWRDRNSNVKRFTWFRHNGQNKPASASRLDYLLTNIGLAHMVENVDISSAYKTDHYLVSMKIVHKGIDRGPGCWKLNNLLLRENKFCE